MAFETKQAATRPTWMIQLRENIGTPDEQPIDLREADAVYFYMRLKTAGVDDPPKFYKPAVIVYPDADPANPADADKVGVVEYVWEAEDVNEHGEFDADVDIEWEPGNVETIPNAVDAHFKVIIAPNLKSPAEEPTV